MKKMRGIILTIEALLSLVAALGLAAFALNQNAPVGYERLYAYQLTQDFAEVLSKSDSNRAALVNWAKGGNDLALPLLSGQSIAQLGNYCLEIKAQNKGWKTRCATEPNNWAEARRTFFDGTSFFVVEIRLGYFE